MSVRFTVEDLLSRKLIQEVKPGHANNENIFRNVSFQLSRIKASGFNLNGP